MVAFQANTDIGNRALQYCGANRMDPVLGFSDVSVRGATEIAFCYDKLRRAELQRATWKFAIRHAALRAIQTGTTNSTDTLLLQPSLYNPLTTYFVGSIVQDENGNNWQSKIPNNLNNDPLLTNYWEQYFGPMTVSAWDTTGQTTYFAGELVYTTPGDGTNSVFVSLIEGNSDNPASATIWSSTATYYKNQIATFFPNWSSGTTYGFGAGVTYQGIPYVSLASGNLNNLPTGANWTPLPLSTNPPASDATNVSAADWSVATAYTINNIVNYSGTLYIASGSSAGLIPPANTGSWTAISGGVAYQSLIDLNVDQEPDLAPALWASGTTYAAGNKVGGSDGNIYSSVGNGNLGNDPVTDGGVHWTNTGVLNPWTTVFVSGTGSLNWRQIGGAAFPSGVTVTPLNIIYPIGTGPAWQDTTRNVFRLPAGFLRKAPQDPKAGSMSWLGAPSGLQYDDWNIEGRYLTSAENSIILLRFVADTVDVATFDDMFCEGLAARIATAIGPTLTQSEAKMQTMASEYQRFMSEARQVNAIEIGAIEPPLDDYITARL